MFPCIKGHLLRANLNTIWMTLALNIAQEKNRSASYNSLEIVAFWEYLNSKWQDTISPKVCHELLYVHHAVDLTFCSQNISKNIGTYIFPLIFLLGLISTMHHWWFQKQSLAWIRWLEVKSKGGKLVHFCYGFQHSALRCL